MQYHYIKHSKHRLSQQPSDAARSVWEEKKSVSAAAKEFNIKRLLGGINKIHLKTKRWWFPIHGLFKT